MKTMRSFAAALAAVFTLVATAAATAQTAAPKPVMSRPVEATVFLQGAELTQTARVTLQKGANEVTIEGLAPGIDPASVRLTIGGGVVVSSFDYTTDYLSTSRAPSSRVAMLRDSIAFYRSALARVEVDMEINSAMKTYLETGTAKNVSGSEAGLGIDELRRTMEYYQTKSEEILTAGRALATEQQRLNTALARVRNQYNEEAGPGGKTSGVLRLNLSAPAAGSRDVRIVYFTPAAGWTPRYDISSTGTGASVTIAAKSLVSQHTGLDWENVRLTLSTAMPGGGQVAPLFTTWFLRERVKPQPIDRRVYEDAAVMQNAYSYDMTRAAGAAPVDFAEEEMMIAAPDIAPAPKTIYDYVSTAAGALSVTYNIELPYTIPGNGREQTIELTTRQTPAEYKYYSAPKLDGSTYLIAEIADWESLELLSGPAAITFDGTYVGETWIDASATREKLTLTLGTDKRVAVTRELARDFSATRTVGSTTEQTFVYRLTVRNSQNVPVALTLKDQYPVSTDRSITVTIDTRTTTTPTTNLPDTGVVTWETPLAPGETRTFNLSYTVKYPKDVSLNL